MATPTIQGQGSTGFQPLDTKLKASKGPRVGTHSVTISPRTKGKDVIGLSAALKPKVEGGAQSPTLQTKIVKPTSEEGESSKSKNFLYRIGAALSRVFGRSTKMSGKKEKDISSKLTELDRNLSEALQEPAVDYRQAASLYEETIHYSASAKCCSGEIPQQAEKLQERFNKEVLPFIRGNCDLLSEQVGTLDESTVSGIQTLRSEIDKLSSFVRATNNPELLGVLKELEQKFNDKVLQFAKTNLSLLKEDPKNFGTLLQGMAEPTRRALFAQCKNEFGGNVPKPLEHEFRTENLRRLVLLHIDPEELSKRAFAESCVKDGTSEQVLNGMADGALYSLVGYAGNLEDVRDVFKELADTLPEKSRPQFVKFLKEWVAEFSNLDYTEQKGTKSAQYKYSAIRPDIEELGRKLNIELEPTPVYHPLVRASGQVSIDDIIEPSIMRENSKKVARDLDLIFSEEFLKIDPCGVLVAKDSNIYTHEINRLVAQTTNLVLDSIMTACSKAMIERKSEEKLKLSLRFWIDVALDARKGGNIALSFAIFSAFRAPVLNRLYGKDVGGNVKPMPLSAEYVKKFNDLSQFYEGRVTQYLKANVEKAIASPTVISWDLAVVNDTRAETGSLVKDLLSALNSITKMMRGSTNVARKKLSEDLSPLSTNVREMIHATTDRIENLYPKAEELRPANREKMEGALKSLPQFACLFNPVYSGKNKELIDQLIKDLFAQGSLGRALVNDAMLMNTALSLTTMVLKTTAKEVSFSHEPRVVLASLVDLCERNEDLKVDKDILKSAKEVLQGKAEAPSAPTKPIASTPKPLSPS